MACRASRLLAGFVALAALCASGLMSAAPVGQAAPASSAVTLRAADNDLDGGKGPFPDLEVTISQTTNLVSQGLAISYRGGSGPSVRPLGGAMMGGQNFLQIYQCWGDDPENPGHPDRRTCQTGGSFLGSSSRDGIQSSSTHDESYTAQDSLGHRRTEIPFVAWNPARQVDPDKADAQYVLRTEMEVDGAGKKRWITGTGVKFSANPYFDRYSTNEVEWAPFAEDGTGKVGFDLQSNVEAPGLGCGVAAPGSATGSPCWIVVVPRPEKDNGEVNISSSPLLWDSWQHHLAAKLDFKPLGAKCAIGAAERQLAGSELSAIAVGQWQPVLCQGDGRPFNLTTRLPETQALGAAADEAPSALALTSAPLDQELLPDGDPLVYAPLLLAGVTISYAKDGSPLPSGPQDSNGRPLEPMRLTPRLVAKLLTASYRDALPPGFHEHVGKTNDLAQDPDFLEVNDPVWARETGIFADIQAPEGHSSMARALWEYVMADPEAKAWLNGEADPWGMKVNPYFSTNPEVNPVGEFSLPTDSFPKADPVEFGPTTAIPEAITLPKWRPYTASFSDGANRVLRGDRQGLGGWDTTKVPPRFEASERQRAGSRDLAALSTSPAAERYQTTTALLRNPAGNFVGATAASLSAAAAAMVPHADQPQVLHFDSASAAGKAAPDAYPLSVPVYGALNPLQADADARAGYAAFIEYAAEKGQAEGLGDGQLPPGYAPIPAAWVAQAKEGAKAIRDGKSPLAEAPTETATPTAEPTDTPADEPAGEQPETDDAAKDVPSLDDASSNEENVDRSDSDDDSTDNSTDDSTEDGIEDGIEGGVADGESSTDDLGSAGDTPDTAAAPDATSGDGETDAVHAQPPVDGNVDSPVTKEQKAAKQSKTPADPQANPMQAMVPLTGALLLGSTVGVPLIGRLKRGNPES